METQVKAKPRRWPVILLFLLVAVLAAAVVFLVRKNRLPAEVERIGYESNVVVGGIPNMSAEERMALLNEQVQRGDLFMIINTSPCTLKDDGDINWLIENPVDQGKLIRVEVFLTDSEDPIYETGFIQPGYHIEKAPLARELDPGTYPCSATFHLYDQDTEEYINKAYVRNMTLTVTE